MASTGAPKMKKPRKPDPEDTDFRSSLRPPARASTKTDQTAADAGPNDAGDGTKKKPKAKGKKKAAAAAAAKGKLPRAPQDKGDGPKPRPSEESSPARRPAAAAPPPTAAGRTATTVDDAQHVARSDGASVMTDTDDDYTVGDHSGAGAPVEPTGKNGRGNGTAPNDGCAAGGNQTEKMRANETRKQRVGRAAASSGDERTADAASDDAAKQAAAPGSSKGRSSASHKGGDDYQSLKQLEKERRAIAQSRGDIQDVGDDDAETAAATPTTLARGNTAKISLPGAYHMQPSTQSQPSSTNDGAVGATSSSDLHDDDEEEAASADKSMIPSSSNGVMSRFRAAFAGAAPTTRPVAEPSTEDGVIDAEAFVHSQSMVEPDEDGGIHPQTSGRSSRSESSNLRFESTVTEDVECSSYVGGDGLTVPIAAEIVPNDEEMAKRLEAEMKEKVKLEVDARLERERKSQVVAQAVHVDDSKLALIFGDDGRFSRRTKMTALALACLLIIIIAVVSAVVSGSSNSSNEAEAPTLAPTVVATEKIQLMVEAIGDTVSSDPTVFRDGKTVQYSAMHWLAEEDAYFETAGLSYTDTRTLVERYVMAVFYFSTNGKNWLNQYDFLEPVSVCNWSESDRGVICNDGQFVSSIKLNKEKVRGNLATELGLLSSLEFFDASENFLSETIPGEIYNLSNLDWLDLFQNALTGSVSSMVGNLTKLSYLDVSNNQLTGSLPTEMGLLQNLSDVFMEYNDLRGELPSELGLLTNLATLWTMSNYFVGTVPAEFSALRALVNVRLHLNDLTGDLDAAFCRQGVIYDDFWADCAGDIPEVTCSCCTRCCDVDGECPE